MALPQNPRSELLDAIRAGGSISVTRDAMQHNPKSLEPRRPPRPSQY